MDLNGKQAAIRAGYAPASAEVTASKLLRHAKVASSIADGKAKQLDAVNLTATRVLEEYRRLAFSDLNDCFDPETGALKPLRSMPKEARAAIASVKATKKNLTAGDGVMEDVVEIKLWDKTRALESLAKHFGLLTEKIEHSGGLHITHELPDGE